MSKIEHITEQCPMEIGLNILSGKWKLPILWRISSGPVRFNELQRELGNITTKVLTQQLRDLEDLGIVKRCIYAEVPTRVEYSLTDLGASIQPVFRALCDWGTFYKEHALVNNTK